MPIYALSNDPDKRTLFPPVHLAEPSGLLAVGGDLEPDRLLSAYSQGIFPWFTAEEPILWWSTDPRMVLKPEWLHIPRSLRKVIKKGRFTITFDTAFREVMVGCAQPRGDEEGTWITQEMIDAYERLHRLGHAHSCEAWRFDPEEGGSPQLVGGVYGVSLGRCFFGESMFFLAPNASKVAFIHLVQRLIALGFQVIDCQMETDHLKRFGARTMSRELFMNEIKRAVQGGVAPGFWRDFNR
ncbi:MAG: leucyl/phenylalanyl-tRNA--protein transferase [Magnetococcales bacterium]|nr:leucyl/phenylalanyl-tRNA--protein transferase [Magnetococcales bacterium]